ncbi:MAG: hypothetical protein JWQ17_3763, partial [Tardiphaga sp.]|nr:hypothetical protein [Tardiphaga sp.]
MNKNNNNLNRRGILGLAATTAIGLTFTPS